MDEDSLHFNKCVGRAGLVGLKSEKYETSSDPSRYGKSGMEWNGKWLENPDKKSNHLVCHSPVTQNTIFAPRENQPRA
jgi:hypothetical protein